jgi:hypothetical protein
MLTANGVLKPRLKKTNVSLTPPLPRVLPAPSLVARRDRRARRSADLAPFTPDRSWLADGGRSAPGRDRRLLVPVPQNHQWGDQSGKGSDSAVAAARRTCISPPCPPAGESPSPLSSGRGERGVAAGERHAQSPVPSFDIRSGSHHSEGDPMPRAEGTGWPVGLPAFRLAFLQESMFTGKPAY